MQPAKIVRLPLSEPRQFVPPTIEEVKHEADLIGLPPNEAERMFYFYSSKDWYVGKNKMKFFKMALAGWKLRWQEDGGSSAKTVNGVQPVAKPLSVFELKTVLEAKHVRANALRNSHYSQAALGGSWDSQTAKREYFDLRLQIKTLNRKLSNLA